VKSRPKYLVIALAAFSLFFPFSSCSKKTEEQVILELVKELARHAEKKNTERIMPHLSEDYSDFEGRGREETRDMLDGYFLRYRGIVINVLGIRLKGISPRNASLCMDVAFSSGAAQVFRKFVKVSTQNYRLNVRLVRGEDQWLVQYAEWEYVPLQELLPESLLQLKKIFPEL